MDSGPFDFWLRFGSVTGFFKTCSFAEASPKTKNPRCTPLHHFCQRSKLMFGFSASLSREKPGCKRATVNILSRFSPGALQGGESHLVALIKNGKKGSAPFRQ
jgi:hypothetical protein